jgi:hypothetical protein
MDPLTKFDSLLVKKGSLEATFFFMMSGYSPKMKGFINLSQQR